MSSVLFNIAIDWVLRRTVEDQRRGIRWTSFSTPEDLDYADELALFIVPHLAAHPGEDRPAQHVQQPGRLDN